VQFIFSDHRLDTERRELHRGSEPVAVEPQVFDLLAYLVENRDRVVSKEDIIAAVWGGRIVSDSALNSRINAARKAVSDSGKTQRLIRTSSRKGFRFIGTVDAPDRANRPAVSEDASLAGRVPALRQEIHFCLASDGVRIAYAEVGKGPPLVKAANWLNHLEYDWESPIWRHLLQALASEHRLIRHDQRGNGLSDREVTTFRSMHSSAILKVWSMRAISSGFHCSAFRKGAPSALPTPCAIRGASVTSCFTAASRVDG
jgi:DNA-binding winged helix-turn-helix (wHTH) protein